MRNAIAAFARTIATAVRDLRDDPWADAEHAEPFPARAA